MTCRAFAALLPRRDSRPPRAPVVLLGSPLHCRRLVLLPPGLPLLKALPREADARPARIEIKIALHGELIARPVRAQQHPLIELHDIPLEDRSEEHTSELQSPMHLVFRL